MRTRSMRACSRSPGVQPSAKKGHRTAPLALTERYLEEVGPPLAVLGRCSSVPPL